MIQHPDAVSRMLQEERQIISFKVSTIIHLDSLISTDVNSDNWCKISAPFVLKYDPFEL